MSLITTGEAMAIEENSDRQGIDDDRKVTDQ
jgi:hypothetical protein